MNERLATAVSDAGPLIHLATINKFILLKKLLGTVVITDSVKVEAYDKGIAFGHADVKQIGKGLADGWIKVEALPQKLANSALKLVERENISKADAETLLLAVHKNAELLVDETLLSNLAKMYGLKIWSTWTLLLNSLQEDRITSNEIKAAIDDLRKTKFALNEKQTRELLYAAQIIERNKRKRK